MKACIIFSFVLIFCGCDPLVSKVSPGTEERPISKSEIPETVKAGVLAAMPNARIVDAKLAIDHWREPKCYEMVVEDDDGRKWLFGVSLDGKVTMMLWMGDYFGNAEPGR